MRRGCLRSVWNYTEHVCIVGETGSGKTYLENTLLKLRTYVVFFRTKAERAGADPMDPTWRRCRTVAEISNRYGYWLLEPRYEEQQREGLRLFAKARREGNWTIAIDELLGAAHANLSQAVIWGYTQGRSGGITMVGGVQRPTTGNNLVPYVLSQSQHSFVFQIDGRDAENIIYKSITPRFKEALPRLEWRKHQFAYYNKPERRLLISDAQHIGRFM